MSRCSCQQAETTVRAQWETSQGVQDALLCDDCAAKIQQYLSVTDRLGWFETLHVTEA